MCLPPKYKLSEGRIFVAYCCIFLADAQTSYIVDCWILEWVSREGKQRMKSWWAPSITECHVISLKGDTGPSLLWPPSRGCQGAARHKSCPFAWCGDPLQAAVLVTSSPLLLPGTLCSSNVFPWISYFHIFVLSICTKVSFAKIPFPTLSSWKIPVYLSQPSLGTTSFRKLPLTVPILPRGALIIRCKELVICNL